MCTCDDFGVFFFVDDFNGKIHSIIFFMFNDFQFAEDAQNTHV